MSASDIAFRLIADLEDLSSAIYEENKAKGFWPETHEQGQLTCIQPITVILPDGTLTDAKAELPCRNVGEALMLQVTELAEALEIYRKGGFEAESNVLPSTSHFDEEIADTLIRIFDMIGGFKLDIFKAMSRKLEYNQSRPPKHGKKF